MRKGIFRNIVDYERWVSIQKRCDKRWIDNCIEWAEKENVGYQINIKFATLTKYIYNKGAEENWLIEHMSDGLDEDVDLSEDREIDLG